MSNHRTEDFWNASHHTPEAPANKVRDKDNAKPELKPDFAKQPAPNVAPKGMGGIKPAHKPTAPHPIEPAVFQPSSIMQTHPKPELLTTGQFINDKNVSFAVEVNTFKSYTGIEGGKITALEIQDKGQIIAQYKDMKWSVIPDDPRQQELVQTLQDQFGGRSPTFVPIIPVYRDQDIER